MISETKVENFNNYTEVDPGSDITRTTKQVTWTGLDRNVSSYVYADKGVNHFSGDFSHRFIVQFHDIQNYGFVVHWALANELHDWNYMYVNDKDELEFHAYDDTEQLKILSMTGGELVSDGWLAPGPEPNTDYYVVVERSGSNLLAYITTRNFVDKGGVLKDVLSITCNTLAYRYIYAVQSRNSGHTNMQASGYTRELTLDIPKPVFMNHYKQMREN